MWERKERRRSISFERYGKQKEIPVLNFLKRKRVFPVLVVNNVSLKFGSLPTTSFDRIEKASQFYLSQKQEKRLGRHPLPFASYGQYPPTQLSGNEGKAFFFVEIGFVLSEWQRVVWKFSRVSSLLFHCCRKCQVFIRRRKKDDEIKCCYLRSRTQKLSLYHR